MTVVGRLAPSPTGHLHIGHARSFLLAWWSARSQGGRVVLRIEDLDVERCRPEFIDDCLRDLEWLGLDWDGSPRLQSAGLEEILTAAKRLTEVGFAYPCVCTRGDIRAISSAPQDGETEWRYPGTCRGLYRNRIEAEAQSGKPAALRFRVEPGRVTVNDTIGGTQDFDVFSDVGDFPILRRNDSPSYQLAVVVDDARDEVTEVLRGDDLLPSAARQQLLCEALKLPIPRWIHVPLVTDTQGRRLAKRADDLSICELRQRGLDPRVLVNWVAASIGCSFETRSTAREVLSEFQLGKISQERVPVSLGEFGSNSNGTGPFIE
jgi:glutamyl-tRNA synthetase